MISEDPRGFWLNLQFHEIFHSFHQKFSHLGSWISRKTYFLDEGNVVTKKSRWKCKNESIFWPNLHEIRDLCNTARTYLQCSQIFIRRKTPKIYEKSQIFFCKFWVQIWKCWNLSVVEPFQCLLRQTNFFIYEEKFVKST